jgi:hypothetical protein
MKTLLLFILLSHVISAQQAVEYFPSSTGHNWYFKITPLDSLNQPIDSLSYYRIDEFNAEVIYKEKAAKEVLSKQGPLSTILVQPYSDSGYINLEGSNASIYFNSSNFLGGIDPALLDTSLANLLKSFEKWYSVYRLTQTANLTYTIFTYDTTVTIDTLVLPLRFDYKGRRLADQTINTAIGTFNSKKFFHTTTLSYLVIIPPFPPIPVKIAERQDTSWIAPQNWIVQEITPSSTIDLSFLGYGTFTIPGNRRVSVTQIVPVELISFSAEVSGNEVNLSWATASEVNNYGFEIFRKREEDDFTLIGFVKGYGTASFENSYSFIDDDLIHGKYFYKLVQIDFDGTRKEYDAVEVLVDNIPSDFYLQQNYPNPFNPSTKIKFGIAGNKAEFVTIKVYDLLGSEIMTLLNEEKSPGSHEIEFNAGNISSGIYFYKISAGAFSQTKKMIIIK